MTGKTTHLCVPSLCLSVSLSLALVGAALQAAFATQYYADNCAVATYSITPPITRHMHTSSTLLYSDHRYLISIDRLDDAAVKLADVVNREHFVSKKGRTQHELWQWLCELISQNPDKITSLRVDPIIRGGLRRFTDMVGTLWNALADYYVRQGNFEKARDVFEEVGTHQIKPTHHPPPKRITNPPPCRHLVHSRGGPPVTRGSPRQPPNSRPHSSLYPPLSH